MAKRHERTRARRAALQVLYSAELTEAAPADVAGGKGLIEEVEGLSDYAVRLIEGVGAHREDIDALLNGASDNWSLVRMPVVDRCILRLAAYEMKHVDAVPVSVSINEAVELAKDFGGEDESPRFVNGVLGRIAKTLDGNVAAGASTEGAADSASASDAAAEDGEAAAAEPAEAIASRVILSEVEESRTAMAEAAPTEDGADA